MTMTQQGRLRRGSLELHPVSVGSSCFPDTVSGSYSSSFDQDTLSLLLAASAQNGFSHDANKTQLLLPPGGAPVTGTNGFDASLLAESEEPGPLPCLPRSRALGSGGPYGSAAAALIMHQQPGSYHGAGSRQNRPRRHSVTFGMVNEHQQQQQAAAYAAALAAAQQGGLANAAIPGQAAGSTPGMGLFNQLPQTQHQQQAGSASPAKEHLQGLNSVQALAAAAQLGMGANSLLTSLALQPPEQLGQQLAGSNGAPAVPLSTGDLADFAVQFNLNAPRLPNAGSCRRHSWAPTGVNGSTAYAQALFLQQQQQRQLAAAAAMGDPRGLLGLNGMSSLPRQKGFGSMARPPAGGYSNGSSYLNGSSAPGSGPASSYAGLAAAVAQFGGLQSAGALAGLDVGSEKQLQHLLQLQQQAGLAATQQVLDPYMEAILEAGQALGQANPVGVLPGLAPVAAGGLAGGLLSANPAAVTQLAQLGLDPDGLSPAAAAAAASMYAPLKVNGVTLDSQLLVAPFADNWGGVCAQPGQASTTPQQLAAVAAGLNGSYGVMSPRSGALSGNPLPLQGAAGVHSKNHKALPTRSGSCGSSSSASSNGNGHPASTSAALPTVQLAQHANGRTSGYAGLNGSSSSSSAGAAAALAAASMVAAAPPMANVCSDTPWDLKKAAEEDAKVLAAQDGCVQRLMAALEPSQTLAKVLKAQAASSAAQAAGSTASDADGVADRTQPVLFGYKLPDTGADAWGGSSSSAVLETAAGSSCISQEPSNKLFVGNIGWWVTEEDLLHWFSRFGTVVHVKIMYNSRKMHKPKDKWRSREYGFIDYATPEEAAKAIVWMDGVELPDLMKDTCGIIVQYAKPTGGSGNGGGSGSNGNTGDGSSH